MNHSLKHFKVVYERGFLGEVNESLEVSIAFYSKAELIKIFNFLGVKPTIYNELPPQREPGKSYSFEESRKFPNLIEGYLIEQPGHCDIFGVNVFIWCKGNTVTISASPSAHNVNDEHLKNAASIERNIEGFDFAFL